MSLSRVAIVLLVEDTEPVREIAKEALEEAGYEVIEANNAATAMKWLSSDQRVDLLFTDVVMPGVYDGAELARRAREARHDLKILITSGNKTVDTDSAAGVEFLPKPYRVGQLLETVKRLTAEAEPL